MAVNTSGHVSPDGRWLWNGKGWEPAPPPTAPPGYPPPPVQRPMPAFGPWQPLNKVDDSFAWFLAAWPIVYIFLAPVSSLIALLALVLHICCSVADVRRVRAAGGGASMPLAILLTPIYLFLRPKSLGKSYAIPLVWSACMLISLAFQL